jgi:hypothetical protein
MSTRFGCYSGWFGVNTFSFDSLSVLLLILLLVIYLIYSVVITDVKCGVNVVIISSLVILMTKSATLQYIILEVVLLPVVILIFLLLSQREPSMIFLSIVGYYMSSILPVFGLLFRSSVTAAAPFSSSSGSCSFLLILSFIKFLLFLINFGLPESYWDSYFNPLLFLLFRIWVLISVLTLLCYVLSINLACLTLLHPVWRAYRIDPSNTFFVRIFYYWFYQRMPPGLCLLVVYWSILCREVFGFSPNLPP